MLHERNMYRYTNCWLPWKFDELIECIKTDGLFFAPECFLQMKVPNSTRPTQYPLLIMLCLQSCDITPQIYSLIAIFLHFCFILCMLVVLNFIRCPFCKTSNYAVEYRGVKTKEEKGLEQIVRIIRSWTILMRYLSSALGPLISLLDRMYSLSTFSQISCRKNNE